MTPFSEASANTSSDAAPVYAFVMRGLLAEEALDRAGRTNKVPSSGLSPLVAGKLPLEEMDEDLLAAAVRMATVYSLIAAFENSVRELIKKVLIEAKTEKWWEEAVSESIRTKTQTRIDAEDKFKWHGSRGTDPLYYTEMGDLSKIIRQNWDAFEPHVRNMEWATQVLDIIEKSRNVIMHSGELSDMDIERVAINIRDWLAQVGG